MNNFYLINNMRINKNKELFRIISFKNDYIKYIFLWLIQ